MRASPGSRRSTDFSARPTHLPVRPRCRGAHHRSAGRTQDIVTYAHAGNAIVAAQGHGRLVHRPCRRDHDRSGRDGGRERDGLPGRRVRRPHRARARPGRRAHGSVPGARRRNLVSVAQASSLVAYAMGAITDLPNADDYHIRLGRQRAWLRPHRRSRSAAVDRAYELGGLDAHDVVGLLTWMHGVAGTHTRWVVGQELWKMFEDGGVALEDIFEQVVAHNPTAWMQGSLIGAMAATPTADARAADRRRPSAG